MSAKRLYSPGPECVPLDDKLWIEPTGEAPDSFAIGQERGRLLSIRHFVAQRIYELLWQSIEEEVDDDDFNCHAAVQIVLGERSKITWADHPRRRGTHLTVEATLGALPLPCAFQIHSSRHLDEAQHSAVLLGSSHDGTAIGFHKNGSRPMELCPVDQILNQYPMERNYLTFYEAPPPKKSLRQRLTALFQSPPLSSKI